MPGRTMRPITSVASPSEPTRKSQCGPCEMCPSLASRWSILGFGTWNRSTGSSVGGQASKALLWAPSSSQPGGRRPLAPATEHRVRLRKSPRSGDRSATCCRPGNSTIRVHSSTAVRRSERDGRIEGRRSVCPPPAVSTLAMCPGAFRATPRIRALSTAFLVSCSHCRAFRAFSRSPTIRARAWGRIAPSPSAVR